MKKKFSNMYKKQVRGEGQWERGKGEPGGKRSKAVKS